VGLEERVPSADRALTWAQKRVPGVPHALDALDRERVAGGTLLAGGLAYRLFFWLVPLGLVVASILSFWAVGDRESLEDAAGAFGLSASAVRASIEAIEQEAHGRWYYLVVGLVLLFWFAIGVVRALRISFAVAWGMRPEPMRRPILAGAVFTLLGVALILVSGATQLAREQLGSVGLLPTIAVVLVYAGVALWMMSLLPHADASLTAHLPGAVLVALGGQAMHLVVALYLAPKLGRSSALYGSLGAATVILLWLYFTARLITVAAFLNAALWERKRRTAAAAGGQP
jgi:membrane protein